MRVVLTALFSEKYPSVGETHALSTLAGQIIKDCADIERLVILDMVALGRDALDQLLLEVAELQPDILAISVSYGTYSKLEKAIPMLQEVLKENCQFVYGGALATYLAADILSEIDPYGIVCIGEGELSLASLINVGLDRSKFSNLANFSFLDKDGRFVNTRRALSDLSLVAVPSRNHLSNLIPQGIQLYAEASRGCSWAHCTFCLRGLLDIDGMASEYRRVSLARLVADISQIKALNGASFTLADEDLLGGTQDHAYAIVSMLEHVFSAVGGAVHFDASATVHSIYKRGQSPDLQAEREDLIKRLAACGLRKIFLGVESGSPAQLRRFAKGHSREEAAAAIALLRRYNVSVELGWIMFDPLCTLSEVRENLQFLIECRVVDATSYLFNELRLQRGTRFERLLDIYAVRSGVRLHGETFDRDTLSFDYRYADSQVETVVALTRNWAGSLRKIHYPLKNLTRYGASGTLSEKLDVPKQILTNLRTGMCRTLINEIDRMENDQPSQGACAIDDLLWLTAQQLIVWGETVDPQVLKIELVRVLLEEAHATAVSLDENSQSASMA